MSDFTNDLNTEKLSEIESKIQELESEIAENKEDINRLEVIEFFDRGEESRQIIVHWLEDVDPETIVSLGDAKNAFVEFSELRAEDEPNEHQVSHGDVLVIGGECPWYAMCAKVDRGIGGGDAGFQDKDPMDVAGTELENDEPYKEFIVWGGCGNGEDGSGGDGDDGCVGTPTSVCISTATASTSGGSGPSVKTTEIITPDPAPDPLSTDFTFNSGLTDFTVVEDSNATPVSGNSFLAFDDNITADDICPDGCGVKLNLKKTEIEKKLHKINATPLEQKKVTITPKQLVTKDYTSMTGTITVGNATISSDKCGNLSSSPGCNGGGASMVFGLATLTQTGSPVIEDADLIDVQDVDPANITPVSVGNLTLPTDFTQGAINLSDVDNKKAFLPLLEGADCPTTEDVSVITSLGTPQVSVGECTDGCQEITITFQPLETTLNFKCGLLVGSGDETIGDNPEVTAKLKVPCGCNEASPCGGLPSSITVTEKHPTNSNTTITYTATLDTSSCTVYQDASNNGVLDIKGNGLWGYQSPNSNGFSSGVLHTPSGSLNLNTGWTVTIG